MKHNVMLLIITATFTGLMAGLFFAWSVSVAPGIGRLPDKEYLASFQAMNRAILNPVFFLCFFGAAILLPVAAWVNYEQPLTQRFWLLQAAAVVYLPGVMGVTVVGNIPLNNALEKLDLVRASAEEMKVFREGFEGKWNMLNHVRTVGNVVALVLVVLACWKRGG